MSARWDSFAEVQASSVSKNADTYIYEAYQKDPHTYVSWMDAASENGDTKITVFENSGKLDPKALRKDGGADALFASKKLHEEKTDANLDQGKLIEKLDEKLRGAAPIVAPVHKADANHGMHTVKNIAQINPQF